MSVEQYQRVVNSLDKEIAELEKKKAAADKKVADAQKKEANVSINENASPSTIKSKIRQAEGYHNDAIKASVESSDLAKKIADKRQKRNNAAINLQKEEEKLRKQQDKKIKQMQQTYEDRICELQNAAMPTVSEAAAMLHDDEKNNNEQATPPQYDVFISHANEDKGVIVDKLVDALKRHGLKVWYDTSEITWGDSLRERIDDGLKKSRFGIVVLSPNYIAEGKYWTRTELDGLFQLESKNSKMLLPIWHNLTKEQVMDYSPIIASRKAMTTATMTVDEIANEFAKLLHSTLDATNE